MADLVQEYYELGKSISATEALRNELRKQIEEWMGDDNEIDIEGLPTLRRKPRSLGTFWDSDAVRYLINNHPEEWRKLIELGCVQINDSAVKAAITHGQLAGKPKGGIERSTTVLAFDR